MAKVKYKCFSVNKDLIERQHAEKKVINKCSVKDFMRTHKLKPYEIKIKGAQFCLYKSTIVLG